MRTEKPLKDVTDDGVMSNWWGVDEALVVRSTYYEYVVILSPLVLPQVKTAYDFGSSILKKVKKSMLELV